MMEQLIDGRVVSGSLVLRPREVLTLRTDNWCAGCWLWGQLFYEARHHAMLQVQVFVTGEAQPRSSTTMGYLPGVRCRFMLDLRWLDGQRVFFPRTAGRLKATSFTRRLEPGDIDRVELKLLESGHEQAMEVGPFALDADEPEALVEGPPLLDALGQYARGDWSGKTKDEAELVEGLHALLREGDALLPGDWPVGWTKYGGSLRDTFEATGFFRTQQDADGRWWLVDPDGGGFFSTGLDCVRPQIDSAVVPGTEGLLSWLPDAKAEGGRFADAVRADGPQGLPTVDYAVANLIRAFGSSWREQWERLTARRLRRLGFNTIANWSDRGIIASAGLPYVLTMGQYPTTATLLFRDFPDVFDPAFDEASARFAGALESCRSDRLLIGYFMSNEPKWGFGRFNLASEMLEDHPGTYTRRALARWLSERYADDAGAWAAAWGLGLELFDDVVDRVVRRAADRSAVAEQDLWAFSREMVRRFVGVPAAACRTVDPHHLNLGLRYAWIASDLFFDAAESFDVFSINCYQMGPPRDVLEQIATRTGKPVIIGEYHFGALDRGLLGVGLRGVASQEQRGVAYRYFLEQCAAHPQVVGAHYFTLYDQSCLGRFDGENWNIGFADVCQRLYPELATAARATHERLYDVRAGRVEPVTEQAVETTRIAF